MASEISGLGCLATIGTSDSEDTMVKVNICDFPNRKIPREPSKVHLLSGCVWLCLVFIGHVRLVCGDGQTGRVPLDPQQCVSWLTVSFFVGRSPPCYVAVRYLGSQKLFPHPTPTDSLFETGSRFKIKSKVLKPAIFGTTQVLSLSSLPVFVFEYMGCIQHSVAVETQDARSSACT